jgi:streptogramin lyase
MTILARVQGVRRGIGLTSLMLLAAASLLAGCGGMATDLARESVPGAQIKGNVHGGQNPVNGATVNLYATGSTGYGSVYSAVANGIIATTTTDSGGNFTLPGYTCPSTPNDQIYIVATGGDSGSGPNSKLALLSALGQCNNVQNNVPFLTVNEVTTVASAYALSGFMTDYAHVGASSGNYTGLANAMATVGNLVNIGTGTAYSKTPGYATQAAGTDPTTFASTVPQTELYALANILAYCVNSNGTNGNCTTLFSSTYTNTTTGGAGTPDTIQAALNIALHPGTNVANLYNLDLPAAPFAGTMSQPNDWTVALTFVGGGLGGNGSGSHYTNSQDLAIDGSGDIWVSNQNTNTLTELNYLGVPQSPNMTNSPFVKGGFTNSALNAPTNLAVDKNGNVFVGNGNNAKIIEFTSAGAYLRTISGGGLAGQIEGLSVDGLNNIWGTDGTVVGEFNNTGTPLSGSGYTAGGDIDEPLTATVDASNNIWVESAGNGFVVELNNSGTEIANSGNDLNEPANSAAIDSLGQFWIPQESASNGIDRFNSADSTVVYYTSNPSVQNAIGISVDGASHIWSSSQASDPYCVTEMSNLNGSSISPTIPGYIGVGGGVESSANVLNFPATVRPDSSGNLWVLDQDVAGTGFVTEFVGLATPAATPLATAVANGKVGLKP